MPSVFQSTQGTDLPCERRLRAIRLVAWVVSGVILVLTLSPTNLTPPVSVAHVDKLMHVLAFFVWAALVTAGWRWPGRLVLVVAVAFGGVIELVQPMTGRDAELADLAADLVGAAAGFWLGLRLRSWARRHKVRDKVA